MVLARLAFLKPETLAVHYLLPLQNWLAMSSTSDHTATMPFEVAITSVDSTGPSIRVSGRLKTGRYFGPEDAELVLNDGRVIRTQIGFVGATKPRNWPILPEHDTVLHFELPGRADCSIFQGAILRGIGFGGPATDGRLLANSWLEIPVFWALHYYLLSRSEDHDESELSEELFGIPSKTINDYYLDRFVSREQTKPWPYFTVQIDATRFVEVEYAEGAECQTRFKLGDEQGSITVGYDSGHFSLPSLRWTELMQIANACSETKHRCLSVLLLFPGIYLNEAEDVDASRELETCFAKLRLFEHSNRSQLVRNVVANRSISCSWRQDPQFGSLCDGIYAQRNPKSLLSNLRAEEFARIKRFFSL